MLKIERTKYMGNIGYFQLVQCDYQILELQTIADKFQVD